MIVVLISEIETLNKSAFKSLRPAIGGKTEWRIERNIQKKQRVITSYITESDLS